MIMERKKAGPSADANHNIHGPEFNPQFPNSQPRPCRPTHSLPSSLRLDSTRLDSRSQTTVTDKHCQWSNGPVVQSGHSSTPYANQRSQQPTVQRAFAHDRQKPQKPPSRNERPVSQSNPFPTANCCSGLKSAQSQGRLDCPGPITVRRFSVTSNYLASPAFFINSSPVALSAAADSQSLLPLSDAANCTQLLDKLTVIPPTIVFHRHRQSSWLMDRRRRRLVGSAPPGK